MNLSYWEYKTWLSAIDYTIVGSGIVGLNSALRIRGTRQKDLRFERSYVIIC